MTIPTNNQTEAAKQSKDSGVLLRIIALFGIPIVVVLAIKLLLGL